MIIAKDYNTCTKAKILTETEDLAFLEEIQRVEAVLMIVMRNLIFLPHFM